MNRDKSGKERRRALGGKFGLCATHLFIDKQSSLADEFGVGRGAKQCNLVRETAPSKLFPV